MEGFDPKTSFGHESSLRYVAAEERGDEDRTVAFLIRHAAGGEALEFAIGAGRIAVPLIQAGVRVDGVEQSQAMIDRLREKPGGSLPHVMVGDMSRVDMGQRYGLVYLIYNTIGNLITQDDQVRCFQNAARHLTGDGRFILECRVPSAPAREGFQFVDPEHLSASRVALEAGQYDPLSQVLDVVHLDLCDDGVHLAPISLRLAHPPELDLMARIAGLRLCHRAGGWDGEPFTSTSWRHVSVYERNDKSDGASSTQHQRGTP